MRFMMMVKSDSRSEAGVLPDSKLLTRMTALNEEMVSAGVMLGGEGLKPSAQGVRVRSSGKRVSVVDGPFTEARELVGGFWLVETASLAEAVAWAKRVPFEGGEIEIRALYEMSDFPPDAAATPDGGSDEERAAREAGTPSSSAAPPSAAPPAAPARQPGTTRFVALLKADRVTESGVLPTTKALEEMGALMDELAASGRLLGGEGLKPSARGARVRFAGDRRTVIDGPFTETKELIAGYSMIQVPSKEEAVDFAKRWLKVHLGMSAEPLESGEIEIRAVMEPEDFGPAVPGDGAQVGGWREREQKLRERLGG